MGPLIVGIILNDDLFPLIESHCFKDVACPLICAVIAHNQDRMPRATAQLFKPFCETNSLLLISQAVGKDYFQAVLFKARRFVFGKGILGTSTAVGVTHRIQRDSMPKFPNKLVTLVVSMCVHCCILVVTQQKVGERAPGNGDNYESGDKGHHYGKLQVSGNRTFFGPGLNLQRLSVLTASRSRIRCPLLCTIWTKTTLPCGFRCRI